MSEHKSEPTEMFWGLAGFALVILALCLGPAGCVFILGHAQ